MYELLRAIHNDIGSRKARELIIEHVIRNIPFETGMYIRKKWYQRRFKRCGENLHVLNGSHILNPFKVECGANLFIGVNNYIQAGGGVTFGNNVMLGPYVKIWTQNHRFDDKEKPVWQQGYEFKPVIIGNDVWIGANVFVMPGAIIGDGCIISANSVIGAKEYPQNSVLAGYPARKVGER